MENQINQSEINENASKINSPASNPLDKGNASKKKLDASSKKLDASSKNIQRDIESRLKDIPKGGYINSPSIYKIDQDRWDAMNDRDRKKFRRDMRSKLQRFSNNILGKDRSDKDRRDAIKEFKSFFKENYISSKLDASSIYQGSNGSKRKEIEDMIFIIENFK
jgi:hypothetical protein